MKEIKFRAWYKPKKEMVNLRPMSSGESQESHICFGCEEYGHSYYHCQEDTDWELMQYTGLKDKNGKEIYEGDIINTENQPIPFAVTVSDYHGYRFMLGESTLCKADAIYGEVIGNIWENKNLLDTKTHNKQE